jgi:hypothetical protein
VLLNCSHKLYLTRAITTYRTIHNNIPNIVTLDKTIKEETLIDVTVANSHNLHSTITEKLQKYTGLTEEFITIWKLQTASTIPPVLFTAGIIPNKLHDSLKLLVLLPALYIQIQYSAKVFRRMIMKCLVSDRDFLKTSETA